MENMSNMHETLGPGGGEVEKWNAFFLPAKRNHLLSASPLILIKEFLELRCFSKRIEGRVLILFLRESWSDNVVFIFSVLLQSCKKARTKQKNPSLSAPSPQARWQGVLLTVCTSMPSGKATWSSAPGWTMECSPSRSLWSLHRTWDSQTSEGRNHTGDSAISPCICSDESLENVAITGVSAFAFSAPVFISWTLSKGSVKDPGQESLNKLADSLKSKMSLCPLAAA